jgi:hypothetical protein
MSPVATWEAGADWGQEAVPIASYGRFNPPDLPLALFLSAGQARRVRGGTMIKELPDMPEGVIGFEASGKLQAEDYRDVLLPVLERAAKEGEVRVVIVLPNFGGMTASALWQDLKIGIDHLRAWKRIALVTDIEWARHMTSLFGWMTPGQLKTFSVAELEEALKWVAG